MNAWVIEEFGGPEVFRKTTRSVPSPGPDEVLIDVAATSVNPIDYKLRSGVAEAFAPDLPAILHGDVSGTVVAVGDDVDTFEVGDRVYGCAGGFKGAPHGALADFMPADADLLAPMPESLTFEQAAALPLVTITAWEALIEKATIGPTDHVLVHGATGGVGHVGLQIAHAHGAQVSVTASSSDALNMAMDLGADHGIRYDEEAVSDYVDRLTDGTGFDVVFDTVGGDNIERCFEATRLNGRMATIAAREEHNLLHAYVKGLSIHTVLMLIPMLHGVDRARHGQILRDANVLIEGGKLRPLVDERTFTFDDIGAAHEYTASGAHHGKVVVTRTAADPA
ncbi:quinone oxidoreductase [Longibacter salinarum]|uniref:Quinone oxidoreductase n=1 Tax=Longibacter salinarum TaxID=1850348 RepID=A0A2A8D119_9BACT|nr:quinone oxidoreductase [Longibacter salinarum]